MPEADHLLGPAPGQAQVVRAKVSLRQPAPSDFTDPLFVVLEARDPNEAIEIANWPKLHGATLPELGAAVLLIFDDEHEPWVANWDGVNS